MYTKIQTCDNLRVCHAQTTHVVAAPHGFACVVIPKMQLCVPSFIEIHSGVSEPQVVEICHFSCTLAIDLYNSLYTSVQAVMVNRYLCCCYGLIFQCLRISLSYIQCTSWGVFNQYSEPLPHDVAVAPVEVADFSKVP